MDNNEDKKSGEELADEALDRVAGGRIYQDRHGILYCDSCGASFLAEHLQTMRRLHCPYCGAE